MTYICNISVLNAISLIFLIVLFDLLTDIFYTKFPTLSLPIHFVLQVTDCEKKNVSKNVFLEFFSLTPINANR